MIMIRPDDDAADTGKRSRSWVVSLLVVATVGLGAVLPAVPSVVFAVVLVVALLPLLNARPSVWIGLAITLPWTSRLLTTTGFAPRVLDFLDFPLVLVAFVVAGLRFAGTDRIIPPGQRRVCWAVGAAALAILASWAFNDHYEPQRFIAGVILALEPFLLLVAILLAPLNGGERRNLLLLVAGLLSSQALFSLGRIAVGGIGDEVKGSLWAAGAGHHVSAGALALAFFLMVGLRVRPVYIVVFGAVSLSIMTAADAKQVMFVVPLAVIVLGATMTRSRSMLSLIGGATVGMLMAGLAIYALLSYSASSLAIDFVDRSASDKSGKVAVVPVIWDDIVSTPATLAFGLGPGESVSRFAFLTTDALLKEGSPVSVLGLHKSRNADRYSDIALGDNSDKSSFTSAQSSALGVVGDYGLAGLAAFLTLISLVISAILRSEDRGLRSAALASWALLLPLAAVFDWLEQPPFTLAVVMITGLALRGDVGMSALPAVLFQKKKERQGPTTVTDGDSTRSSEVNGVSP